jgi:hypothetical protein
MEPQYDAQDMAIAYLAEQNHALKKEREQLLAFVKEIADLSIFGVDHAQEMDLIFRARTLTGQPEF